MKQLTKEDWFKIVISILLFGLVWYKAAVLSMTHDESASYYYIADKNIWGYLFNSEVWPNANNHWFNTILFQFTTSIIGPSEIAIRLPNVLSFCLFSYASLLITRRFTNKWLGLGAFLFIIANPYLLDFFSMARGYGISLSFVMLGLYYSIRFIESEKNKYLVVSLFALIIASLCLFSALIFIPSIMGGVLFYLVLKYYPDLKRAEVWKPFLIMVGMTILALILTITPLRALSGNAEFEWGSPDLLQCFQSLVYHGSYGKPYRFNELFTIGLGTAFLTYAIFKSIQLFKNPKHIKDYSFYTSALTTFVLLVLIMIVARHLLGTYYPTERKTIIFIPFLGLICFGVFDVFKSKYSSALGILGVFVLVAHFILSFDGDQVREWWYDRDTKEFYQKIVDDSEGDTSIGCHWMFHPTLSHYAKIDNIRDVKVMNYNKEIDITKDYDYFMSFNSDDDVLKAKYDVLYRNPAGRVLWKLKE